MRHPIYVDQLLRSSRKPPRYHKLMLRQISALRICRFCILAALREGRSIHADQRSCAGEEVRTLVAISGGILGPDPMQLRVVCTRCLSTLVVAKRMPRRYGAYCEQVARDRA